MTVQRYADGALVETYEDAAVEAVEALAENQRSIEDALSTALGDLQTTIDTTNATINSNPAAHIKTVARAERRIIRLLINRLDGTT